MKYKTKKKSISLIAPKKNSLFLQKQFIFAP